MALSVWLLLCLIAITPLIPLFQHCADQIKNLKMLRGIATISLHYGFITFIYHMRSSGISWSLLLAMLALLVVVVVVM